MNTGDINRAFYNKLYRRRNPFISVLYSLISFDQQSKSKINYRIIRQYLQGNMRDPMSILDYGFGHGSLLLKYDKKHFLYGCDISEQAVRNFPRVAAVVGKTVKTTTVEDWTEAFGGVKFDIITLSHIVEHVENDQELIRSLLNRLSDSGILLINVPINEVWDDPKHVRKYDLTYLRQLVSNCNLKIHSTYEADKLTSFFLIQERVKNPSRLKIYLIKVLRASFAIMPYRLVTFVEKLFLQKHKYQQLIVLTSKT